MVGLDDADELRFFAGAGSVDATLLPDDAAEAPQGAIVEVAPARAALMAAIAERIGRAWRRRRCSSTTAISSPASATRCRPCASTITKMCWPIPAKPTSPRMSTSPRWPPSSRAHGLDAQLTTQGEFLLGMGLLERAGRLGAKADANGTRQAIADAVERLAGPDADGRAVQGAGNPAAGIASCTLS